jgi:tetratricopeptide (TPR) repeat protein
MSSAVLGLALWLGACAAAGVPATDDPADKLQQARYLYNEAGRPAQAEPLILEAMATYRQAGDNQGLALAHREYAYFLSTPGSDAIITNPAAAPSPVAPDRLKRALSEMREATRLFGQLGQFDRISNTTFGEARINHDLGDITAACRALARSLEASDQQDAINPGRQPALPPGMTRFAELIDSYRKKFGCPS